MPACLLTLACLGHPGQALAEIAGSISLDTNTLFRGETISKNDPSITLSASVDGPMGLFAGASATVASGSHDPRLVSLVQYAGIAARSGETSVELGVIHRHYDRMADGEYPRNFFELFAGITHRSIKVRAYASPDYLQDGRVSYYGEVNARLATLEQWSLDGHAGLSLLPDDTRPASSKLRAFRDWRLQVSRPVGRVFLAAGVAGTNYPVYSRSGKARVFAAASFAF